MMILLLCIGCCAFCGCERSLQTDVVLFCQAFNARSETLVLREENTYRRSETEYLLYAEDILFRLKTDAAQAIHTVILSANADRIDTLQEAAKNAFYALSEPFTDDVPESFLAQIHADGVSVLQVETEHFVYLLFRSADSITVQQINRHYRPLTSRPGLRSSEDLSTTADHASQSR